MSNKNNSNVLLVLVIVLSIILAGVMGLYFYVVKDDPVFQFIGRIINPEGGADSIRTRRKPTDKPFDLTNNQRYYKELVGKNNINILIIGPDETSNNYDTLMIASLDDESNSIKFINLPRDIYIDYSDKFKKELKKVWSSYSKSKGIYKINAAHLLGEKVKYKDGKGRFGKAEYDFTSDIIEEVFDIYIDDFVLIKPSSLRKIVDYFGGVEIDVPYLMKYKDPTQNLDINIKKGLQVLDGKGAEGFVRYRQGTDEKGKYKSIGDIERKNNQVAFVKAFLKQHMNLGNIGKIVSIFKDLNSYVDTSVNAKEAAEYGKIAERLYRNKFTHDSEEIECKNVSIDGIYYLKIKQK
ncbi:MAG: LCP family protein [Acetivibrionales bacterium]|jgi:LCP family protein required for cell wall assembly